MRAFILMMIFSAGTALAMPTGTVTRAVITDTNGVLIGSSTNLLTANGIASSGVVAAIAGNLASLSNLTVSGLSNAAAAHGSLSGAVVTVAANLSAVSNVAASALQPASYAPGLIVDITTNAILSIITNAEYVIALQYDYTNSIVRSNRCDKTGVTAYGASYTFPEVGTIAQFNEDLYWSVNNVQVNWNLGSPSGMYTDASFDPPGNYNRIEVSGPYPVEYITNYVSGAQYTTNTARDAYLANLATNTAQGIRLNSAAQRSGLHDSTNISLVAGAGCSLAGQVATLSLSGRVTLVASEPFSDFSFASDANQIGCALVQEYWHNGGWTNEVIYPCYSGSVVYSQGGPDSSADRHLSNWVVAAWSIPATIGTSNDLRGTTVTTDSPVTGPDVANKSYVDAVVGAVTPANWAQYPATDTIRINGHMLLAGGWSLTQTAGVGIVSYGDVWATSNQMVLAHNGNPVIRLASGYTGLTITNFSIAGGIARLWVATNGVVTTPQIQTTLSLMDPQWSPVTQTNSYPVVTNGSYLITCAVSSGGFYRAVQQSGANTVTMDATLTAGNMILSSVNWIDLIAPGMMLAGASQAPSLVTMGTAIGLDGMGYDVGDAAYGVLQMPHGLALTNALRSTLYIVPHVHWVMTDAPGAGTTNVTWRLIWEWANIGGTFSQYGTNIVTVGGTQANIPYITSFGNITNNGAHISSIFRFKLGRVASAVDDYGASDAVLDQFDVHVPVDRIGSYQELTQ